TPSGVVTGARVRRDGEVWYAISRSCEAPVVMCGSEILRPPGRSAPPGAAYRVLTVGQVHSFVAERAGPGPHPTIFQVHGGPAYMDTDSYAPGVQAWVDHGFVVVMVNYRGSAGYGRAWRDAI